MGLSVYPAASVSVPSALRPPTFSYSNSWDLSGLSGITAITGSNVMTYRKTDNTLYFAGNTGGTNSNFYKFDLTSKTGSTGTLSGTNSAFAKDLVAAQNGDLYWAYAGAQASANDVHVSTNGGSTWTNMGTTTATYRGYLSLIDAGEVPGITGNIVWQNGGQSVTGTETSTVVFINNSRTGNALRDYDETNDIYNIKGGRYVFSVKDGDDSPAGSRICIATNAGRYYPTEHNGVANLRYASLGTFVQSGSNAFIQISSLQPQILYYAANTWEKESSVGLFGGKPTSIQNRWIVAVQKTDRANGAFLTMFDYENNLSRVGAYPLRTDTSGSNTLTGQYFTDPIYISATKKLYIAAIYYTGGVGVARMYEYNVTTY